MDFTKLIIISILVESIWENLKMTYKKQKLNINMIGSLALAIIICIIAEIDIFSIVGIELRIPAVGYVLTGVVCSRGANAINDLLSKLRN